MLLDSKKKEVSIIQRRAALSSSLAFTIISSEIVNVWETLLAKAEPFKSKMVLVTHCACICISVLLQFWLFFSGLCIYFFCFSYPSCFPDKCLFCLFAVNCKQIEIFVVSWSALTLLSHQLSRSIFVQIVLRLVPLIQNSGKDICVSRAGWNADTLAVLQPQNRFPSTHSTAYLL